MFLSPDTFSVRVLSVLRLDWDENIAHIEGRTFRALSFRLQGNADFSPPDGHFQAHDKDIVYSPENCAYDIRAGKEAVIVIHFSVLECTATTFEVIAVEDTQRTESLFLSLLECWTGKQPGYYYRAVSIFYKILELLDQQALHAAHSPRYALIRTAVEYLQQNYRNPELTVQDLCNIAGISTTYFRTCFFEEFQVMPNKYLNALRIDYAKELLASGTYSIERVAGESGFLDSKYFSTVFKRFTGKTPAEYKKQPETAVTGRLSASSTYMKH